METKAVTPPSDPVGLETDFGTVIDRVVITDPMAGVILCDGAGLPLCNVALQQVPLDQVWSPAPHADTENRDAGESSAWSQHASASPRLVGGSLCA